MEEQRLPNNSHLFPSSITAASSSSAQSFSHTPSQTEAGPRIPPPRQPNLSYRVNISISNSSTGEMRDEAYSCLVVLVTFWFFAASMTLILGFYGSVNLQLGPNCSRLLEASSLFVQEIKVRSGAEAQPGPVLYDFHKAPSLEAETNWTEVHSAYVPANFHREWIYYLNQGSEINISYSVKSADHLSVPIVIAQGEDSFIEWLEEPSYPNITLSWNNVHGDGVIRQKIFKPDNYYIAVGNINAQEIEIDLNFSVQAFLYNTTRAFYKCSLHNNLCILKLLIFGTNAAVLTTPGIHQGDSSKYWYVKLSYGPRWVTYLVGSGGMTLLIFLVFKIISKCQHSRVDDGEYHERMEGGPERAPLLPQKEDDISSWGSSYGSISHDEEEEQDRAGMLEVKMQSGGETSCQQLCIICFNEPRDSFFLPCGHCAACFACGMRIAEDAGTCPICRRKMRKVRKIFTV